MRRNTECIAEDNGFVLWVQYETDKSDPFEAEPGNPNTAVAEMIYTNLLQVVLQVYVPGGKEVFTGNLLPTMTDKMKTAIISKLTYQ